MNNNAYEKEQSIGNNRGNFLLQNCISSIICRHKGNGNVGYFLR